MRLGGKVVGHLEIKKKIFQSHYKISLFIIILLDIISNNYYFLERVIYFMKILERRNDFPYRRIPVMTFIRPFPIPATTCLR